MTERSDPESLAAMGAPHECDTDLEATSRIVERHGLAFRPPAPSNVSTGKCLLKHPADFPWLELGARF